MKPLYYNHVWVEVFLCYNAVDTLMYCFTQKKHHIAHRMFQHFDKRKK